MADTTSTRLDRIEGKLDQLTEAMVAMARAEERIANLQDDHNEMRERMNRFSRKLDDIKATEAMDPVDHSELKGSHADRKDKDINNDGKVTGTDKYLHKRRKAVSKAVKGETATMNPKMDTVNKGSNASEQKESTLMSIRDKLVAVLEKKAHGDTEEKQAYDDNWSPSAKKMAADHKPEVMADVKKATDDNAKAEKQAKVSPKNPTDKNAPGDKNIINKPEDITKKGGVKESLTQQVNSIVNAYKTMYAAKIEETEEKTDEERESNS
jgi:hypothetical protein